MSQKRDYYEVLAVARDASPSDLQRSYRQLAMKYPPDRNPGDKDAEDRFKEAAEAYEVLSDDQKRATYDRHGHEGLSASGANPGARGFDDIFSHFSDVFGDLFGMGGGRRRGGAQKGQDLGIEVELGFFEAVKGTRKSLEIPRDVTCEPCSGSGARPGSQPVNCTMCDGRGAVVHAQGLLRIQTTCPQCRGQGRVIRDRCTTCGGQGTRREVSKVEVNIPAGVDSGSRVRKPREGMPGTGGGPPGDLIVMLHVAEHPTFKREDAHIHAALEVDFTTVALGGHVTVETVHGPEKVHVESGTQQDDVIRLRGKGLPRLDGHGQGDHYVHVRIAVPRKLNKKQRKLLEEFAAEGGAE